MKLRRLLYPDIVIPIVTVLVVVWLTNYYRSEMTMKQSKQDLFDVLDLDAVGAEGLVARFTKEDLREFATTRGLSGRGSKLEIATRLTPRYTVQAGRAIYRDGKFFFTINIAPYTRPNGVTPCEGDELTHILCALLNHLGSDEIDTTYLGDTKLRLRK
jgi:hypothetical protein